MRARAAIGRATGPFLLPARFVLVTAGVIAVGLGTFTVRHEYHAGQVDRVYTSIALIVGLVWLACLGLGFTGRRQGVFGAGAIAFVQFGVLASTHFVSGPRALGTFVTHEGLPVVGVAIALVPACALVIMSAAVCWTNPKGRNARLETTALLVGAFVGVVFLILQATDGVHRGDFGTANTEDGAFAAAILASFWLAGGLWIGRARRAGALLIAVPTLIVWYSFVTLHFVKGGTSVTGIASRSGIVWAVIDVAAAVLAAASFIMALTLLARSISRRGAIRDPGTYASGKRLPSGP